MNDGPKYMLGIRIPVRSGSLRELWQFDELLVLQYRYCTSLCQNPPDRRTIFYIYGCATLRTVA
jgi:hypothetical protein